jgi:hypothetical protein
MLEQSKVEQYTLHEQMQLLEATLLVINEKHSDILTLIKSLNHTESGDLDKNIDTLSKFLQGLGTYSKSYNELMKNFYQFKKEIK